MQAKKICRKRLEMLTLDVSGLKTTAVLNTNIGEVVNETRDTSLLLTTAALNTEIKSIGNKISGATDKTKQKLKQIIIIKYQTLEKKYISLSDYNKFTSEIIDAKKKQKQLVNKSNISSLVKYSE